MSYPTNRRWHYVRTLYVWVKRFAGVQRGLSLKAPFGASPASYVRGCAQEIGRRGGTGETERPKPERRFGKGKLTERGRDVGNFAALGYDRD